MKKAKNRLLLSWLEKYVPSLVTLKWLEENPDCFKKQPWQIRRSLIEEEKDLQKTCTNYLDKLAKSGRIWYFHDYDARRSNPGLPDLIIFVQQGIEIEVVTCEFKTPKGDADLTDGQEFFHSFVHGHPKHVILNDFYQFKDWFDAIFYGGVN